MRSAVEDSSVNTVEVMQPIAMDSSLTLFRTLKIRGAECNSTELQGDTSDCRATLDAGAFAASVHTPTARLFLEKRYTCFSNCPVVRTRLLKNVLMDLINEL